MRNKWWIMLVLLLVLMLGVWGCPAPVVDPDVTEPPPAEPDVTEPPPAVPVGAILAYTGPLAEFGPHHEDGIRLAMDELNAAAEEILGGPIISALIAEDSETAPAAGVDRARKLVDVDGVPAIIGALASGVSIPISETVTTPARVLQISPASTSPLLSLPPYDQFLFRTTASDALQGVAAAMLARGEIIDDYIFDTASTMYVDNPYGKGLNDVFVRAFEMRGGKVLAQVPHPEEPLPTYVAELELALEGNPDMVMAFSYPGQATIFLAEARDIFEYNNIQYCDGTKSEVLIEVLGADYVDGRLGTAPGSDPDRGEFLRFQELFEERYGRVPPVPFVDSAYDAMAVVGLTIAKAVIDGLTLEEITGDALVQRIRQVANPPGVEVGVGEFRKALELLVAGEDINYTGAAGDQDFDDAGDVVTPIEIWHYIDGTIRTIDILREVPFN